MSSDPKRSTITTAMGLLRWGRNAIRSNSMEGSGKPAEPP
jgi:hypothetical protein